MENKQKSPGMGLLKVVGILMIILGVGSLGLLGAGLACSLTGQVEKRTAFMLCGMRLVGVLQFIAGIVGVRNCSKLEKTTTCLVWSVIAMVSAVIGIILGFMAEKIEGTFEADENIYGLLFVLPILYLIGAVWNRNEVTRETK